MPFVNGQYQADTRSPMQRLYDLQKTQDAMQQLKAQQDLQRQRMQILRDSYTPAQAAQTQYMPSNPILNMLGMNQSQDVQNLVSAAPQPANFVERATAAPRSELSDTMAMIPDVSTSQTEAKPASFDAKGAIARLYGAGDLEGARSLVNDQYKDELGAKVSANGGEKWYGNGQMVKGTDGKLYKQLTSSAGNTKLVPVNGDPTSELKLMNLGGRQVWANPYTGEPVKGFDVTPTDYQSWQMNPEAQADQAAKVEDAKVRAKNNAEQDAGNQKQDQSSMQVLDIANQLKNLAKSGYLGSSYGDRMMYNSAKAGGFGSNDPRYLNTAAMEPLVTNLMLVGKPPGMGAMSDSEWEILKKNVADPSQYPNSQAYLRALDSFISTVQGRMNRPQAAANSGGAAASRPAAGSAPQANPAASAPKPGTMKGGYVFMGGNPADPKSWRKM